MQYSDDAEHFAIVGEMSGYGTTTEIHQYIWTDSVHQSGYYRLVQYDRNGESTPSSIIFVEKCKTNIGQMNIFPACVSSILTIQTDISRYTHYQIYDINTRSIRSWQTADMYQSIDLTELISGMYVLVVYDQSGYRENKKFFKL